MKSMRSNRDISVFLIVFTIALGSFATMARAADANLHVQFTTTEVVGGTYIPRHVHVVWIKDSSGNFVTTVGNDGAGKRAVWANNQASRLIEWYSNNPQANTDVAARTGATQSTYQTYTFDWNWRTADGSIVPDGNYQIHFLQTSSNAGTPNHHAFFDITKGAGSWSTGPTTQNGYNNVSLSFTPATLGVEASAATNVTSFSATLNGLVTGTTGGVDPEVFIYWGTSDGGTVSTNWDNEAGLGVLGVGDFSADVTDLNGETTYYYRCYVTDSTNQMWSDVISFTTPIPDAARINIDSETLDFGQVPLGSSEDLSVTLQNNGQYPLDVQSLTLVGLESQVYSLASPPALPFTLDPVPDYSWANQDIGNVSIPGSVVDNGTTITVEGSGADIWSTSDEFHFYYTSLAGDGSITARVDSIEGTDTYAKSGVMMRESLTGGSKYAMMAINYAHGATFQKRTTTGGSTTSNHDNTWAAPYWVRLVRSGNTMTGYVSPDGQNWTQWDTATFTMNSTIYIGLNVCSHSDGYWEEDDDDEEWHPGQLCTSVFSNLSITPSQDPDQESLTVRFSPTSVQDYKYARLAIGSSDPDKVAYVDLQGSGGPDAELGTRQVGGVGGPAKAVAKYGDNVLLGQGAMLVLLDVSNPASPSKMNQIRLDGVIEAITVQGDVAYVALGNTGFAVVDLNNFMPLAGAVTIETGGFAHDIDSEGNFLCIADGIAGTHVYDISMPLDPKAIHTIETAGAAASVDIMNGVAHILDESEGVRVVPLDENLTREPVVYLKLDETDGSVASDTTANGYDGTLINMDNSDWVSGKIGNGLSFDGVDDYVQIPDYKGITGTAGRTCTAWVQTTQVNGIILSWGNQDYGGKWIVRVNSGGQLRAEVQGGYIIGTTLINDGQWHHVAAVLANDGSPDIAEAQLYVDGQLETISAYADEPVNTAGWQDVVIGACILDAYTYFEGLIDEVRIYDDALTESAVNGILDQKNYNEIEFGTRIKADSEAVHLVDSFGNYSVVDVSGDPNILSQSGLQIGSAADVEVQGDYAYVTGHGGLEVFDISDLTNPASIAFDPNCVGSDSVVEGTIAYVAGGMNGLSILDITNPYAISLLGSFSMMSVAGGVSSPDSLENIYVVGDNQNLKSYDVSISAEPVRTAIFGNTNQAEDVRVEGQYAYVAAGLDGLKVFDLLNPTAMPGTFATNGYAAAVSVNSSTAMVCDSNDVYVLDISSPMSPSLVGTMSVLGWGSDVAAGSSYGYVAEGGMGISILNLSTAQFVSSYPVAGPAYGLTIDGDVLYVACGTAGVAVLDISAPAAPSLITEYDLPGMIVDVAKVADKLCVADAMYGVSILDVSNPVMPTLYASAATSAPAFHISSAGSRILVADKKGGLAVLGVTDWPKIKIADIVRNDQVDIDDLAFFASQWLNMETDLDSLTANMNYYDTNVNLRDLSVLSQYWQASYENYDNMTVYLKLDETSGSVASDTTANGHDGTLINMDNSDWVSSKIGNGLSFDGIDDYVQIPDYKGITGTAGRTCTAWVQTTQVNGIILSWGNQDYGGKWIVRVNSGGQLRAEVQGGYIIGTTLINDGQWHHVAAVLTNDGSPDIAEAQLYVDGQLETISAYADEPVNTAGWQDVVIGACILDAYTYFEGLIDDVRIYDEALTEQQIGNIAQ